MMKMGFIENFAQYHASYTWFHPVVKDRIIVDFRSPHTVSKENVKMYLESIGKFSDDHLEIGWTMVQNLYTGYTQMAHGRRYVFTKNTEQRYVHYLYHLDGMYYGYWIPGSVLIRVLGNRIPQVVTPTDMMYMPFSRGKRMCAYDITIITI